MKGLAIFGIIMGCLVALTLQHVSNFLFRKCNKENDDDFLLFGSISIILSIGILYTMFYYVAKYF
jgi:hypothetical protein